MPLHCRVSAEKDPTTLMYLESLGGTLGPSAQSKNERKQNNEHLTNLN